MKTDSILFAQDVPHYGCVEITAADDAAALEAAEAYDIEEATIDPDHENGVCKRIVHVEDDQGNIVAEDIPLDGSFLQYGDQRRRLLCDDAPALLNALEAAYEQIEILVDFSEPGKDPEAEAVAAEVRALIAKHRSAP